MESEPRLIRLPELSQRLSLGKTKIYEMVKAGEFPKPVKRGRASLWPSEAVNAWIRQCAS